VPLIFLSFAWITGLYLGAEATGWCLSPAFMLTALAPLPLLIFMRQRRKMIILISLGVIIFFGAASYSQQTIYSIDNSDLRSFNDSGVIEIRGMVARDPDVRDSSTHLYFSATELKTDEGWREVDGTALLFVPRYPAYDYGDILAVTGKAETPARLDDFDYENYLAHQGIYTTIVFPAIQLQERGRGIKPLSWIYTLRNGMSQTLAEMLAEPQASLAQGMILGMRGNIPPETRDDFNHTGTAHLLAISGLHLGIMAGVVLGLGLWLFGKRYYLYAWLALAAIWFYAIIAGLQPPIIRAAIMTSLFLFAEILGRQRSAINALAFAAAIMAGISPFILGDASFQLSFLAMAGLIFLFPPLKALGEKAFGASTDKTEALPSTAIFIINAVSVTLAALIAVWPVVAYYFGTVSLVGPLATFLVLPVLPAVIISGALAGLAGLIALPVAQAFGWLSWLFLSYMTSVIGGLSSLPLSHIEIGGFNPTLLWIYYLLIAAIVWFITFHKNPSGVASAATSIIKSAVRKSVHTASRIPFKWVMPPLLIIAIVISFGAASMPDDSLHVSFLDVGQGDAILIQKGSQQVLIDGGPSPQALNLALSDKMPFWDRTIELIVLTHPHQDHLGGLVEALRRYHVEQVLQPDSADESPLYAEWLKQVETKGVANVTAQSGQRITLDGAVIEVLNPQAVPLSGTQSDTDNNSVVLRLTSGKVSFFLTADIMEDTEWELIKQRNALSSSVLKVAHHGSQTSTTPEFLTAVNAQAAVIMAGRDNKFGHPDKKVTERLDDTIGEDYVYCTATHGTVEFITDGERLWVETAN